MLTIGVLGGIGPQATMDFEARVHRVAQRVVPQRFNEGYPPMVTVYMRHAPVVVHEGKPTRPLTLDPRLLDAAARLGSWADVIVIPSNTPHHFLDEIREASGSEVLSLVDVTVAELRQREVARVGLVGLGIPDVYEQRFAREGLELLTAPREKRDRLDDAILRLMEGAESTGNVEDAAAAIEAVRAQGPDAIVLGCTEIPLLLGTLAAASDLVNPSQLLAEAVVRRAVEPRT